MYPRCPKMYLVHGTAVYRVRLEWRKLAEDSDTAVAV